MIEEILERAGIEVRYAHKKGEVTICCPFCAERGYSDDNGFHFGLNVLNGLAHCYRCDWRSSSLLNTGRQLAKNFGIRFQLSYSALKSAEQAIVKDDEEALPIGLPESYEKFCNEPDSVEKKIRAYLRKRGVTTQQIVTHHIGFAAVGRLAWRVLFPVLGADGGVYGCVARAVQDGQSPKYLNSPGIKLMWGAQRAAQTCVVVEGILDALSVEKALLRKRDWIAVARLGSTVTPMQLTQLRQYERIIVLPDRDAAGLKGAAMLAEKCIENHIPVEVAVPAVLDGKDPGDMLEDEIDEYLGAAKRWTYGVKLRLRVRAA